MPIDARYREQVQLLVQTLPLVAEGKTAGSYQVPSQHLVLSYRECRFVDTRNKLVELWALLVSC